MHGVYKYEHEGKVLYIGKTSNTFESRFYAHSREDKFKPYLEDAALYIYETRDEYEADFLETVLINQYKPILNEAKNMVTSVDTSANVQWVPWSGAWVQKRRSDEHRAIRNFSFTLREDTVKLLKELAKMRGMSASSLVDQILEEFLEGIEIEPA